jgi:hypothetical protein
MGRFDHSIKAVAKWLSGQAPKTGLIVRSSLSGVGSLGSNQSGSDATDRMTGEFIRSRVISIAKEAAEKVGGDDREFLVSIVFRSDGRATAEHEFRIGGTYAEVRPMGGGPWRSIYGIRPPDQVDGSSTSVRAADGAQGAGRSEQLEC